MAALLSQVCALRIPRILKSYASMFAFTETTRAFSLEPPVVRAVV